MSDECEADPLMNESKKVEVNFETSGESSKVDENRRSFQKHKQTGKDYPENELDRALSLIGKQSKIPDRRNSDIIESVEAQDLEWMKRCLEKDSSPEATCEEAMMSVGHLAAYFGNVEILREVIARRPDLFKRADSAGRTPMHYAAWQGHLGCLAILLGLRAEDLSQDVAENSKDPKEIRKFTIDKDKLLFLNLTHGEDVVHYAVCDPSHSCSKVTKLLNVVWSECTPLHEACARVQTDCVLGLLACGTDITQLNAHGKTSLDILGLAINEGKNILELDTKGFERIIEAFILYGKCKNIHCKKWLSNKDGTSPLHIAIQHNMENATKLLLEHGADPKVKNKHGQTSLHLAVLYKRTSILKCLFNLHRDDEFIEVLNGADQTPLQLAVSEIWFDGVSILLGANASIINQSNSNEDSALHFAARAGNPEILEKLIKKLHYKKKSIDSKNKLGETPLFVAIKEGNVDCVECLLKEGASHTETLNGYTVIHKAIESDNSDVLSSLLNIDEIRASLNIVDANRRMTPLHWAAQIGRADCTKSLINKKADMTIKNSDGDTALHIAAEKGHYEVIKEILKEDKTKYLVNIEDNNGWLPFYRAANNCHRESIQLFLENGSNLSEIIPKENTLIIEIIKNKMPRSAEFLNHIFDNCITSSNDYNFDHPESEIVLNYSIIIPDEKFKSNTQKDAIAALFSSGNNTEIKKLILHPLIQSFVFVKWNILKYLYLIIFGLYFAFVLVFTHTTIQMYDESQKTAERPEYYFVTLCVVVLILTIMVVDAFVLQYMRVSGFRKYFLRLEVWSEVVKLCSLIMALSSLIMALNQIEIPRLLVAVTHLLCWLEVSIMVSRFQEVGYYSQMYFNVALKVIKVFTFLGCFLIIGFSSIFWILKAHDSTTTFWDSLTKTVVMMTSEFDYSSMMESSVTVNQVAVQIFFLLFLVSVPIIFMALLLALAITDVKDLINEGKIQRLIEQVVFIRHMELLINGSSSIVKYYIVNNKIKVYPGIFSKAIIYPSKGENILPRKIIKRLLENLNERNKISNKKEQFQNM